MTAPPPSSSPHRAPATGLPLDESIASSPRAEAVPPSHPVSPVESREDRSRLAARVLVDAVLLGALGDALLRATPWGVNLTIWALALIAALVLLARRRHEELSPDARWLLAPAVALTLAFAWRGAESLTFYNAVAFAGTLALLGAALSRSPSPPLADSRIRDLLRTATSTGFSAVFGVLPLVIGDISYRDAGRGRTASAAIVAFRAVLLALPLLLIFGSLLASADPVFARLLGTWFSVDAEEVATHLFITGVITWYVAGFLRGALIAPRPWGPTLPLPPRPLGVVEISAALGSLVVLFLAFVAVQFRYFFGGADLVGATAGLSYADYARRGFFELVAVSALVLPLLLGIGALRREEPNVERAYRVLSGALLSLLAVIMYSAFARMRLYQDAYGLTTDRLYATAFIIWLAIVFAWFARTVLRGRPRRFAIGALMSAWGVLACVNVLDPAAFVARTNIARAQRGHSVDLLYLRRLGADAVPLVADYLARGDAVAHTIADTTAGNSEGHDYRCDLARDLIRSWGPLASSDWRSWTLARARAREAVRRHEPALRDIGRVTTPNDLATPCMNRRAPAS